MRPGTDPQQATLETLQSKIGQLSHLPTLPEAATRAMAVARDPHSSSAQLAAVIERDPVLAATILKRANSAINGVSSRIETLPHAVTNLNKSTHRRKCFMPRPVLDTQNLR